MHFSVHNCLKLLFVIYLLSLFNSVFLIEVNTTINGNTTPSGYNDTKEQKEQTNRQLEARKKEEKDMMSKILPLMVIPFMVSTAIIPMMLLSLKFMLLKSAFIGKLAVLLLILNMFRSRSSGQGGVFNHNVDSKEMSMAHYGYSGEEEYGAYINGRKI